MVLYKSLKAKFFFLILLPALLLGFAKNLTAQEDAMVIQSIGTGIVHGKDVAAARDEAISNAMVTSVQRALADLAPMETIVSNFKKLDQSVFDNITDYILEYKILAENASGKTYRVMLEATLFSERIRKTLSNLDTASDQTGPPKVLFFLAEQRIDDIMPSYWWGEDPAFVKGHSEKAITKALIEQGFSVIDHAGMLLYGPDTSYINNPYLDNDQAIQLGGRLEADIVVVGTAIAEIVPNTMGAASRSFKGNLSVRAIQIDTGEEIASVDQQSVTVSSDNSSGGRDALSNAGAIAGKTLATRIDQAWKQSKTTSGQIDVFVKGTGNLGNFVSFRKSLSQLPGVTDLRIKEAMADEALILINYTGSPRTMAESIMQISFDNFGVNISEVGRKHISMDLVPGRSNRSR